MDTKCVAINQLQVIEKVDFSGYDKHMFVCSEVPFYPFTLFTYL